MKCILHIGTEKTGTTTLQHFLEANKSILLGMGYGVLGSMGKGNNRRLASYAMKNTKLNDDYFVVNGILTTELKAEYDRETEKLFKCEILELKAKGCHTIIISSEHFHSRCDYHDEIEKLYNLLYSYFEKINILCYIRPQIELGISVYSTILRSGSIAKFQEFLSSNIKPENKYYDYLSLYERWSKIFGSNYITMKKFDKSELISKDIVKDFLHSINIKDLKNLIFYKNHNESLNPLGQELLRLNNFYNYQFKYNGLAFKKFIYDEVNRFCIGKGSTPSKEIAINIQKQFENSNNKLSKLLFGEDILFNINYDKFEELLISDSEKKVLDIFWSMAKQIQQNEIQVNADTLREVALAFEESNDIETAYKIMEKAKMLRPNGPFINQKLQEYIQILDESF